MRATLPDGSSSAVNLACATNSSCFSKSTGYSMKRPCLTHSTTPIRQMRSSPARSVNGSVGNRVFTSERNWRDAFILSEYFSSRSRLKTVVLLSSCFGLPSPVLITMSKPKTSPCAKTASFTCCSVLVLLMITLFASMTCFFIWWESTPSTGEHLYDSATFAIIAVISALVAPSLNMRCASSAAVHAAIITSALRPSTASAPPTTALCASTAM
mmetsp:Transcript_34917/g.67103  ORF Transcript_34917/g.67103 Transcript_34917/m.67103 type:complete len:213 (-) Transcript_34917:573-1211(-)